MGRAPISRPDEDEYPQGIQDYLDSVEGDDLLPLLDQQLRELDRLAAIGEERGDFRYETDKWSVKELLVHVADSERVFAYRALRIGRGDDTPLPGYDEKRYGASSRAAERSLADVIDELRTVRAASITLIRSFDEEALSSRGVANARVISARAASWVIAGHFGHHMKVLRERYGV